MVPSGRVPAWERLRPALLLALGALAACRPAEATDDVPIDPIDIAASEITLDHPAPLSTPLSRPESGAAEETVLDPYRIVVDCGAQRLALLRGDERVATWPVSTSRVGLGNAAGSNRTPLGRHRVAEKLGASAPLGTVFRARRRTGEVAQILVDTTDLQEDLVLTRILWLEGLEPGVNRGAGIDSKQRYIYIHGTNEEGLLGQRASHGCVRMSNRAVVELFELVPLGTEVRIVE